MPNASETIAIVGIGGLFPGAAGVDALWGHVVAGRSLARDVPRGRWTLAAEDVLARGVEPDRVYSTKACFLDEFKLDTAGLNVDPAWLVGMDPLIHVLLYAGRAAWRDAVGQPLDRSRVGVILGNIALPTDAASSLAESLFIPLFERQIRGPLWEANPFADRTPAIDSRRKDSPPTDSLNRFVAGLPAGVLAQALRLGGGCYTLDAACASSLYAIKLACDELREGRADAMLAGGVSRPDSLYTQMGFSQLRALSPSGLCRPFDEAADGLVVGEGAGILVLKRLDDAIRHGDRIYATIAGIGLSNDVDGNLMSPDSGGQLRAMHAAYQQAGLSPRDIDLVECHGTGTPIGDATEFESLRRLWAETDSDRGGAECVLGSVKSNIGHLLTAAGAAGMIKTLLALRNETLPPTAGFARPPAKWGLEQSPFRVLSTARPWRVRTADTPRRAAVSAFGFGGINAHVIVEEYSNARVRTSLGVGGWGLGAGDVARMGVASPQGVSVARLANESWPCPIAVVGLEARVGPWASLAELHDPLLGFHAALPTLPTNWCGLSMEEHSRTFNIGELAVPLNRFRIPPSELAEMLPQQLLMLDVAARALEQTANRQQASSLKSQDSSLSTGVFIGIALDMNTTNYHVRWSLANHAREWSGDDDIRAWTDQLRDAWGPALTANRTMGALGSIVASRIARAFRIGGPSFTVSSEDTSGLRALEVAARALRRGELDMAIVGAVDFATDPRVAIDNGSHVCADGAAALVLKRFDDAVRDGDRIAAVVRGIGAASGRVGQAVNDDECCRVAVERAFADAGIADADEVLHESATAAANAVGHSGAASGMMAFVRAVLALRDGVVPADELPPRPWLRDRTYGPRRMAITCSGVDGGSVCAVLEEPAKLGSTNRDQGFADSTPATRVSGRSRIHQASSARPRATGKIAFVYPGAGNQLPGMGRELALLFPEVLQRLDAENERLASQFAGGRFWSQPTLDGITHRDVALGQVWLGSLITDILATLGVRPDAAIGYSLGESAALFALRAWTARDEMLQRMEASPLFTTELAGPCLAARRAWNLTSDESVDWILGVVDRSAEIVQQALAGRQRVYLLIVNTPAECVVGGQRQAVDELVAALGCAFHPIPGVTTVHCEVAASVREEYRALHMLPTAPPEGVTFYSGVLGRSYDVTSGSAADSIVAQAVGPFDFPRVIRQAYDDGVRMFLEIGPGSSCTRMIGQILGDRPHVAQAICTPRKNPRSLLRRALTKLAEAGVEIDVAALSRLNDTHGQPVNRSDGGNGHAEDAAAVVRVAVGRGPIVVPRRPRPRVSPARLPVAVCPANVIPQVAAILVKLAAVEGAKTQAQQAFLHTANEGAVGIARARAMQQQLTLAAAPRTRVLARLEPSQLIDKCRGVADSAPVTRATIDRRPNRPLFDRAQCLEFAVGSIARVLGTEFAEADTFPTRVRLPAEPLMLVDRILSIEGKPRSLGAGRIITEHDILPGAWYLDGGRIPTCIAVEAGQADLFLSAYLGIDFVTRGRAVYRLLDAAVTFHAPLPGPGATIRYDIHIDRFFRQGETHLFRFRFDATVDGHPLLSMRDGCAGFFTSEQLAAGRGIVLTEIDRRPVPGKRPDNRPISLESSRVARSESSKGVKSHNTPFEDSERATQSLFEAPLGLPTGRMSLVHRVLRLDPAGGRFGLGQIVGEADIHPDDWFLTCHFVDDQVMPGTLMYECCLHTLRIFLRRVGISGNEQVVYEPLPGVSSQLKCRGQVTAATRRVQYELTIKELGHTEDGTPFVLADALMYADQQPIVQMNNMSLRIGGWGLGAGGWGLEKQGVVEVVTAKPQAAAKPKSAAKVERTALCGPERILAFAIGKPSEAFGERYRVFDYDRIIARLPGPPYQFLDRIVSIEDCQPWELRAGGVIEAEYDVPPDAWYFEADRHDMLPYAVLLEAALQPCGWLAAYLGSALTSEVDLSFRNLGGNAVQHAVVPRNAGTLTTRVKITNVARSGGMLIQNFDFAVRSPNGEVFTGDTYFGFFSKQALSNQVGIRDYKPYEPTAAEQVRASSAPLPPAAPFPDDRWRMIDRITLFDPRGGPHGLGVLRGDTAVDPAAWFFRAHFNQDPVWPGSLGLESLLQLLKYAAVNRWSSPQIAGIQFQAMSLHQSHSWTYRGQILPTDREVQVQAVVTAIDDSARMLRGDGALWVDSRLIYRMQDFAVTMTGP